MLMFGVASLLGLAAAPFGPLLVAVAPAAALAGLWMP